MLDRIDLRKLRYFVSVAETGSFSKAASVLNIAQPALSRNIKELEEDLGLELFYRHGRGVDLTDEGEMFLRKVQPLLHQLGQICLETMANASIPKGKVSVAMPHFLSPLMTPSLLTSLSKDYPRIELNVIDGMSASIAEWLANGRVDIAIVFDGRSSATVMLEPLFVEELCLLMSSDFDGSVKVAPDGTVDFREICKLPLITSSNGHSQRRCIEAAAKKIGEKINIFQEIDSLASAKLLILENRSCTLLPYGALHEEAKNPKYKICKVRNPRLTSAFSLATSTSSPVTLAAKIVLRLLRKRAQSLITDEILSPQYNADFQQVGHIA